MEAPILFDMMFGGMVLLGGFVLRRIFALTDRLSSEDKKLHERITYVQTEYVSKKDFDVLSANITLVLPAMFNASVLIVDTFVRRIVAPPHPPPFNPTSRNSPSFRTSDSLFLAPFVIVIEDHYLGISQDW